MQESIDVSMIDVCTEKGVSLKQVVFTLLFFVVAFIVIGYPKNSVDDINFLFVKETNYKSSRDFFKKK